MGYCMAVQVGTILSTVMYKSGLRMGKEILRRVLMVPCEMLLGDHLSNTRSIALLGSGRVRVGGLGDAL